MRRSGPSLLTLLYLTIAVSLAHASLALAGPSGTVLASGYWGRFLRYWGGVFGSVGGVVLVALSVGVVSLFIITRGKWKK